MLTTSCSDVGVKIKHLKLIKFTNYLLWEEHSPGPLYHLFPVKQVFPSTVIGRNERKIDTESMFETTSPKSGFKINILVV